MRVGIKGGFTNSNSKDNNCIEENFSCANQEDSHHRRIVLQSQVDWRDSLEFHEDSGKFRVVVTAEVNPSESMDKRYLEGNLLIYPLRAEPELKHQRENMNIHTLCHLIKSEQENRFENFNKLEKITSGQEPVDALSLFSCSIGFQVAPNGITKLKHNNPNQNLVENSLYIIARQAFYYLKYSIHDHKHHTSKQDSLTTITSINNQSDDAMTEAALRLVCQLKRELTYLKRIQNTDGKEHPSNNAAGIIAYIKSLTLSLKNESILSAEVAERELKQFEYVKESFSAQTNKIESKFRNIELVKSKSKVVLGFLIISLWGAINFMFRLNSGDRIQLTNYDIGLVVSTALAIVFFSYIAIKKYYINGLSPEASEHLYRTPFCKIFAKAALALFMAIFFILLQLD
tara:strand:- start:99 stop:1301 length:1203 start_codon:yes stop_codon:yes gene_type:complete